MNFIFEELILFLNIKCIAMKLFRIFSYFLLNVNWLCSNVSYFILDISNLYILYFSPLTGLSKGLSILLMFSRNQLLFHLFYYILIFYFIDFWSHFYRFLLPTLFGFGLLFLFSTFLRKKFKSLTLSFYYFLIYALKSLNFPLSIALAQYHNF